MKKITIGRGRECDVRLSDSTDKVSRRHAVITFTPLGKMTIYDTSTNGTFVNGIKIEKPNGVSVKRGDQVNFAYIADLDWSKVKDPYKSLKVIILVLFIVIVATVILYVALGSKLTKKETEVEPVKVETQARHETEAKPSDTLILEVPQETPSPQTHRTRLPATSPKNPPTANKPKSVEKELPKQITGSGTKKQTGNKENIQPREALPPQKNNSPQKEVSEPKTQGETESIAKEKPEAKSELQKAIDDK